MPSPKQKYNKKILDVLFGSKAAIFKKIINQIEISKIKTVQQT